MICIRLARTGAKKRPFYHIVVANQRSPLGGRYIERLGFYNPSAIGQEVELNIDQARVTYWTQKGASLSSRVQDLLKQAASKAA